MVSILFRDRRKPLKIKTLKYCIIPILFGGLMKKAGVLILLVLLAVLSSAAYAGTLIAADTPSKLFFGVGKHYFKNSDFEKASDFFEKAIEENGDYAEAYHNLAVSQYKTGNFKDTIVNFEKATSLNPEYASAYYNLGLLYFETGNYENAMANFEKSVELEGTPNQHFDLAQSYVALFRQKEDAGALTGNDLSLLRNAITSLELAPDVEHSQSNIEIINQVLLDYGG